MRKYLIIGVILTQSCGARYELVDAPKNTRWHSVAKVEINAAFYGVPQEYSIIQQTTNVTYTSAEVNNVSIDTGALVAGAEVGDSLPLGNIVLTQLVINNLNQCGTGAEACTYARIAMYTISVSGSEGIEGFVNTSQGYGVPIKMEGLTLGLGSFNAVGVEVVELAGIRRLRDEDFVNGPYFLSVDMSNAGIGNYEANIVVDIQLGVL